MRLILGTRGRCKACSRRFGPHVVEKAAGVCDSCALREDEQRGQGTKHDHARRAQAAVDGYLRGRGNRGPCSWRRP